MADVSGENPASSRRDFLSGRLLREELLQTADSVGEALLAGSEGPGPRLGATVRLGKVAMACDFDVILNPDQGPQLWGASEALDLIDRLEDQMTVYRPHSEMSQINARAADEPVVVERQLFELLQRAEILSRETEGCFDPTSGPMVALWRQCKREGRLPHPEELAKVRELVGFSHVQLDSTLGTIRYDRPGVELNLGAIGKGYALDRASEVLDRQGIKDWFLHGGHSSILACGDHAGNGGWPIAIRNPLFPERKLVTLVIKSSPQHGSSGEDAQPLTTRCGGRGVGTSGSGVQFFRLAGKRYGHLLDPRTGWPVEGMLSVTVLAPTAAEADALSTAFFVMGVEKAREYCDNHVNVSALIIPPPTKGQRLEPVVLGIPEEDLFWAEGVGERIERG